MSEIQLDEQKLGDVKGKVAVVTGGASGIGEAIVRLIHKKGGFVFFGDVNATAGQSISSELGGGATFMRVDVLSWKELRGLFSAAREAHGRVDFVFANAGINQAEVFDEDILDEDGELADVGLPTVDVDLTAVIKTSRLAWHHFRRNSPPGGSLVITGSTSSYNARPNIRVYSAAKHGVLGLMRALAADGPKYNNSTSLIAPSATATGILDVTARAAYERLGIQVQSSDYVALGALFLASNGQLTNGYGLNLMNFRALEVEGKLAELQPQWQGFVYELAASASNISFKR
ncbi:uncharacterized protein A1O5_06833 [Cladophialophora psammophila CBS 110553]|uniref:3-oxoacyl-[acyl-carrier protein] reductase n=1 Tax=Cladophialophora psammophila CBS 110553 TaxID=1182543 RepID=W9WNI1_9EURO|nr:uncharacterized protein A1O5_06833 [Cladophialophora psammophila CBS 110553]EXJ69762.1 hypothetical protein A1O5_06833 [Cladophialophora psammophila CBS 110553]